MLIALALLSCAPSTRAPGDPAPGWLDEVSRRIQAEALAFHEREPGRFLARPWRFRAELGPEGLLASRGEDRVGLRLSGLGREDELEAIGPATPALGVCIPGATPLVDGSCARAVELSHADLVESWRSGPSGVEQSWEIAARPAGTGSLLLRITVSESQGWEVDADGRGATLLGSAGGLWRYVGLEAMDAAGEPLLAWMEPTADGLGIRVEDAGALYPITIDPVLDEEIALGAEDGESVGQLGWSVDGAGDTDGDGYDDVIVGVYRDDELSSVSGAAYVFLGSAHGPDQSTRIRLVAADDQADDAYGACVAGAGDTNGDGYDDVLVTAYKHDGGGASSGVVYVYPGGPHGPDPGAEVALIPSDAGASDFFGRSAAGAGDTNHDGYDDLVVGAYGDDDNGSSSGSVYVFPGGPDGPDADAAIHILASDGATNDFFGYAVAGAGDLNGDGYADIVAGAYGDDDLGSGSGAAYVYPGGPDGPDTDAEIKLTASDAAGGLYFGLSVGGAGDTDGDGYDDLFVGTPYGLDGETKSGAAYLYPGGATGPDAEAEQKLTASDAEENDQFGCSVDGAGDIDGDGYDDLIVGARQDQLDGVGAGSAYVYPGSARGPDADAEIHLVPADAHADQGYGRSVAGAGDTNGDGYDDLIVGAPENEDGGVLPGSATVYLGTCAEEQRWYEDADGDGHGDPNSRTSACAAPDGFVDSKDDCDDADPDVSPEAEELCGDGVDNDCDGEGGPEADDDGDGLSWTEEQALGTEDCAADTDEDGLADGEDPEPTVPHEDADTNASGDSGFAADDSGAAADDSGQPKLVGDCAGCATGSSPSARALLIGLVGLLIGRRRT